LIFLNRQPPTLAYHLGDLTRDSQPRKAEKTTAPHFLWDRMENGNSKKKMA
jgi:hypothetical protein